MLRVCIAKSISVLLVCVGQLPLQYISVNKDNYMTKSLHEKYTFDSKAFSPRYGMVAMYQIMQLRVKRYAEMVSEEHTDILGKIKESFDVFLREFDPKINGQMRLKLVLYCHFLVESS